jgi:hypothetical protein
MTLRTSLGDVDDSEGVRVEELSSQCVLAWLFSIFFFTMTLLEMRKRLRKLRKCAKKHMGPVGPCVYIHQKSKVTGAARSWCHVARYDLAPKRTVIIYCTLLNLTESGRERRERKEGKW